MQRLNLTRVMLWVIGPLWHPMTLMPRRHNPSRVVRALQAAGVASIGLQATDLVDDPQTALDFSANAQTGLCHGQKKTQSATALRYELSAKTRSQYFYVI